ncbi:MBOAT family protein [Dyadobacter sp. CY343]|uniref:MBOAT family O-acyltransferase n=1 Tax=Dyadobacter sp. CY343 TaxID=2907299 RepID=UPI001F1DCDA3|nr:MBOAT family O-acyltransferase [Dyadobacter sp. CY343]MCE7061527.1 MBOAT family protein [Dyadobacter sp. CY343]
MLFNSFEFALLVIASLAVYYLPIARKIQVHLLIIASLVFYGYSNPKLLALFLSSVVINVTTSYLVVYARADRQKLYAIIGVVVNLLILIFFKYGSLVGGLLFDVNHGAGAFLANIPLPIGISFFTFEGISLVVDAYKGRDIPQYRSLVARSITKHALNTTFFVAFFPHLIAGPILKAHDFIPQISEKLLSRIDWEYCYRKLVTGYFLKMVIADQISQHTFWIRYPFFEAHSSLVLITLLFGFSMQIFADFAGYSLIAQGIAGLFGYKLMENFNFPYISTSFSEFWRRWHISLSSFLKEYLYIPLGGNRKGEFRTYFNLFITMVLGGLWHGAAWSYAVWGTFHGLALVAERLFIQATFKDRKAGIVRKLIGGCIVFLLVTLAWLLFKLTDIQHVYKYLVAIVNNQSKDTSFKIIVYILIYSIPVVVYHGIYLIKSHYSKAHRFSWAEPLALAIMLFMIVTNTGIGGDFIYFQF